MKLNLTANSPEQEAVKGFLEENVSEVLTDKINNGVTVEKDGKRLLNKKDLDGFFLFASEEARKLVANGAKFACVKDETVFGWAIHYFEEDSIEGKLFNEDGTEYKPVKVKIASKTNTSSVPVTPPKPQPKPQMSLFDMLSSERKETEDDANLETETDEEFTEEEIREAMEAVAEEETKAEQKQIEKPRSQGSILYERYMDYQRQYPNCIIAMRLGDFYEVFGDNATTVANELDLVLTGRDCGLESRVPMCGFPYHCAELYFGKIALKHFLTIVESNNEIRQIPKKTAAKNIDYDTGEVLTEEEMRAFDGDIFEPKELFENKANADTQLLSIDNDIIRKLTEILGDCFIVR